MVKNKQVKKGNIKKHLSKMVKFYDENLKKKNRVLIILGIIMYIILVIFFMNVANQMETANSLVANNATFFEAMKFKIIFLALVVFAGWVPYFYIPVIAYFGYMITISNDVALYGALNGNFKALSLYLIPTLIDILTISIVTSVGMYWCRISSKKYIYSQRSSFGLSDVKIQLYEITGKKEKAELARDKKQKKIEKMEKNNVKTDYKQVLSFIGISIMLELIVVFIEVVIL